VRIDPKNLDWREAHNLLTSVVVPRPIAFVSTIGKDNVFNVAPFSLFTGICHTPMVVGFSIGRKRDGEKKDTLVNIESSGDFVINIVTEDLAEAMNQASKNYPSSVDEFKEVGLMTASANMVKPPLVADSPVNMECRLVQMLEFGNTPRYNSFVIGEVLCIHIKDEFYANGQIQAAQLKTIGRLGGPGGALYCRITDIFEMKRPD
jgi:flavin reductase (DIM6/NTAB) family NADH-FMN oxidoreductase RutF